MRCSISLSCEIYCDDHSSLSSTTAVQYNFYVYFTFSFLLFACSGSEPYRLYNLDVFEYELDFKNGSLRQYSCHACSQVRDDNTINSFCHYIFLTLQGNPIICDQFFCPWLVKISLLAEVWSRKVKPTTTSDFSFLWVGFTQAVSLY